jgi:hypothetical protein
MNIQVSKFSDVINENIFIVSIGLWILAALCLYVYIIVGRIDILLLFCNMLLLLSLTIYIYSVNIAWLS